MEHRPQEQKNIVIGLLAHVDAGKTTLAESLLYAGGAIRKQGRVDHRDSFLDTDVIERKRGITVLTKPAVFTRGDVTFTLLDTPGHTDFGAEAERSLSVLDAAVLVVSAPEGIQSHTRTLWELLKLHRVPTFLFFNKTDLPCAERAELLSDLARTFRETFCDMTGEPDPEQAAEASEELLNEYLAEGTIRKESLARAADRRELFPVVFGAALKNEGTERLLELLSGFVIPAEPRKHFGARVIKISHEGPDRLTWLKITGGALHVKDTVTNMRAGLPESARWEEKINEIRLYSGTRQTPLQEALPGCVCAVTGLTRTFAGEGLGCEADAPLPRLAPVVSYALILPAGVNKADLWGRIQKLGEEDPLLRPDADEETGELRLSLMGTVHAEVVKQRILDRLGVAVEFGPGKVLYRETICAQVRGIGHFEPLRHFAHVELLLEPGAPGSGLVFRSEVSGDVLSKNWQRLILTHLGERRHKGVLTGSPITDLSVTLTYGKAHLKHTEGGDFRQATYRAVRQALMQAESLLLEPYYRFSMALPAANLGRAMTDIRRMCGETDAPVTAGEEATLTGTVPVAAIGDYYKEFVSYTRGLGKLTLTPGDYRPCHNAEEVISERAYDPESDLRHTPDSVFCAGGAGFTVKWNEVAAYMKEQKAETPDQFFAAAPKAAPPKKRDEEAELRAIYERTYGKVKDRYFLETRKNDPKDTAELISVLPPKDSCLLVDGYNILFAWDRLKSAARDRIDAAREMLIDALVNYQSLRGCSLIAVFDAYKVNGGEEHIEKVGGIYTVFTREAEIADVYIEKVTGLLRGKDMQVQVATGDGLEQLIILGQGALRVSATAFVAELEQAERELQGLIAAGNAQNKSSYRIWERIR